jgi:membrane protein implicated in regulation of membrane protease activity
MSWLLEQFQTATTSVAFLSIFVAGVLFSGISMLLGHHGADDHHGGDHEAGPSLLSVRGAALFFTGFGGVGYIVNANTGRPLVAMAAGVAGGLVFSLPILYFIRFFMRQETSSLVSSEQIVGAEGIVTTSIAPDQYGEVRISVAGSQISKSATSDVAIKSGTPIKVVRHLGGNVFVTPLS